MNGSQLYLNKYGTIQLAKNFKNFTWKLNWCDFDKSKGSDHYEANFPNFGRDTLHPDHNENLNESGNKQSILLSEYNNKNKVDNLRDIGSLDPWKARNDICQKNSSRLIIAQLNIRNKFKSLSSLIKDNVKMLLVSKTKIDSSFPTAQFHIDAYTNYRRNRNENGGGALLYVRDDVPTTFLKINFFRNLYCVDHIIQLKTLS